MTVPKWLPDFHWFHFHKWSQCGKPIQEISEDGLAYAPSWWQMRLCMICGKAQHRNTR